MLLGDLSGIGGCVSGFRVIADDEGWKWGDGGKLCGREGIGVEIIVVFCWSDSLPLAISLVSIWLRLRLFDCFG